jgi:hypothetical protein
MANCCEYEMMIVGKTKESIERLVKIMKYEDPEFFIYRVFDVEVCEEPNQGYQSDLWVMKIFGDVAWSAESWIKSPPNKENRFNGAYFTNLLHLCKELDIGVEIYTKEQGCCFQEYYLVNNKGELVSDEYEDWHCEYDDDGNILSEEGGIEHFGEFSFPDELYGK